MIRTYSDLALLETHQERYDYLRLAGGVGVATFGFERWLNQRFYTSSEWRQARHAVIVRDNGCDLGIPDHEIFGTVYVHHMNPLTARDIEEGSDNLIDPEVLISVTHQTHNAIHYGDASLLRQPLVERRPGDTALWGSSRRRQ